MVYQINTRVWVRQFGTDATLQDVPEAYWEGLAAAGIKLVWLMGVWQTADAAVPRYALVSDLVADYSHALPDWTPADVIGSPYAIDRYVLAPSLGEPAELQAVRAQLHRLGMKLILDFVPNHFHAESSWLTERPEVFLEVQPDWKEVDGTTFYEPPQWPGRVFAHGKDPYYAAWQDTVQVNYQRKLAHLFMQAQLLEVAHHCDGVRCDMAMLPLNEVFRRTWGFVLPTRDTDTPEFWPGAIQAVKTQYPDFVFVAEVYWDMEWTLQQQGFDYTYDKRLLDRIKAADADAIRQHLNADADFQLRSLRFLENHDEERIQGCLSHSQAAAAAVINYTIPGLLFFYDGQWEGRRTKLPVQLGREPAEMSCSCAISGTTSPQGVSCACTWYFYQQLLLLIQEPVQQGGHWAQVSAHGLLSWRWYTAEGSERLVVVNYRPVPTRAPWPGRSGRWHERFSGQYWDIVEPDRSLHWYPYQYLIADLKGDIHNS